MADGGIDRLTTVQEGMEKRFVALTSVVNHLESDLRCMRSDLERQEAQYLDFDSTAEADPLDEECLQEFRSRLCIGMPVHVEALGSRPDLNGKAGILRKWHVEKGRWEILVGKETMLIKPGNLVP